MRAPPNAQGNFERQQQHLPFTLHLDACEVHARTAPAGACDTVLV